jgi:hypothetical protein
VVADNLESSRTGHKHRDMSMAGVRVNVMTIIATTFGPLLGVLLGAWATQRTQSKSWHREDERYLLDARRQAYGAFITAVRSYFAYAQSPSAKISSWSDPENDDIAIPLLDEAGVPYRERLDAAHANVRLVARTAITVEHAHQLARAVRKAVASRADFDAGRIPRDLYQAVWAAERQFINTIRSEMGMEAVVYEG